VRFEKIYARFLKNDALFEKKAARLQKSTFFLLYCSRLFVTLRLQREVFRFAQGNFFVLAIKIIEFYFVLLSTFRNFASTFLL